MNSDNQSFRGNFETLLALFKKLANKMSEGEIQGMDPQFANQFKSMLGQYEMMKHMMPHDIPEQFREPFRQMMESMIHKLNEEVGDDIILSPENNIILSPENKEEKAGKDKTIEDIEEMLGDPDLDPVEMDKLLDEFAELKSKRDIEAR